MVPCDTVDGPRLDDRKIQWLLTLASKAEAASPQSAEVAAEVRAELSRALGGGLCAAEAQQRLTALCMDGEVREFMRKMIAELPFLVGQLVGDPCKQDLGAAAERWLP